MIFLEVGLGSSDYMKLYSVSEDTRSRTEVLISL
jgi:hypothetical protein